MSSLTKAFFAAIITAFMAGCASLPSYSQKNIVSIIQEKEIRGSTFAVYPLDASKLTRVETSAFLAKIVAGLESKGMRSVDPRKELSQYFFVFDYASELGIKREFEHAILLIGYDVRSAPIRQIYKAKIIFDSTQNGHLEVFMPVVTDLLTSFPGQQ